MNKKIITNILVFISAFLILKNNVQAVSVIGQGDITTYGTPCKLSTKFIACVHPKFQFRATLVDKNGNKIAGTNSVDFAMAQNGTTTVQNAPVDKNIQYNLINGNKYNYKYGENSSNFKYITMNFGKNYNSYGEFIDDLKNNTESFIYKYKYDGANPSETSFLSLFLYYSGFNENVLNVPSGTKINIEKETDLANKVFSNEYYLLIEQTFMIYYNTNAYENGYRTLYYRYGTGNELLEWMYNSIENSPAVLANDGIRYSGQLSHDNAGYMRGLTRNFIEQAACDLKTESTKTDLGPIKKNTKCEEYINKLDSKGLQYHERIDVLKSIIDSKDAGYGVYAFKITHPDSTGDNLKVNIDLNMCEQTNGIVTMNVKLPNDVSENYESQFFTSGEKSDGSKALFCYDRIVRYDFSGVINDLNGTTKTLSNIKVTPGTVTVTRECIKKMKSADLNKAKDFSDYEKTDITLTAYNKTLKFKNKDMEIEEDSRINIMGTGKVTYTMTMSYELDDVYVNKNALSGNGYISFNNFSSDINKMFGYSSKIIRETNKHGSQTVSANGKTITYVLNKQDAGYINNNPVCKFNYNSTGDNTEYNFRVISLENPFPGRSGKSRIPGINWLNEKNYVFDYITNNRGIRYVTGSNDTSPEAMYTKTTPMYTVTLTPKTMMKIREYNKNHSYADIKLSCDSEDRQCLSQFLLDKTADSTIKIEGTCKATKGKESDARKKINLLTTSKTDLEVSNIIKSSSYNKTYDFNKNNRFDSDDIEIYINKDKNTFFYTCANKTYQSGG